MINLIPIQLCSSCLKHEIASWVNERIINLKDERANKIRQELKTIRLTDGECIVCKNNKISNGSFINILKLLEKTKAEKTIINEFAGMFGYEKTAMKI